MWPSYANPVLPPMPFAPVPPIGGQGYFPSAISRHAANQWAAKRAWRLWRDRQQAMLQKRYYHRLTGLYHGLHFPTPNEVPYGFNQVGRLPRTPRPRDYQRMPGVRTGGWDASAQLARYEAAHVPPNLGANVFPVVSGQVGAPWGGGFERPREWLAVWARTPGADWRLVAIVESVAVAELVAAQFGVDGQAGYDSAITGYRPFEAQPPAELQGTPP